jgi:polar amino acid transport system substrate-binding protein
VLVALCAVGALAACSQTDVPESLPGPTTATTAAPEPTPPAPAGCTEEDVVESVQPPDEPEVTPGSYMQSIVDRGRLRVGVDTSTLQFSIVDPTTGAFEGFDVEIAREVAEALFGEGTDAIEFVAIPYSERVNVLATTDDEGVPLVDLVADTFTINCRRDEEIDFSSEYYTSEQKLLVPAGLPGDTTVQSLGDELGRTPVVCAAAGSTSVDNLNALEPAPEVLAVPDQADCLVAIQQGRVDAISTDDTILAGMVVQDPTLQVVGEGFSAEPYGLGLPPDEPEWVAYVNAVLEDVRSNGRWVELFDTWLRRPLGIPADAAVTPPAARYDGGQ